MNLGISTASLFNRVSTESCFDIFRQLRIDTAEVFLNTFSEYEKPFVTALAARKGSINVHSVHALGMQFEPQLFNANARVRSDAENIFRKVCYSGYLLGAKYYCFHGPIRLKKRDILIDYIKLGDRLNQLIDIAQSYGIKIAYENVHWAYGAQPEFFKQMSYQCPNMYMTLDVKQAIQAGVDPIKFLDIIPEKIATIHLCDVEKDGFSTALPGKGKYNFEKFFIELNKRNINTTILLEVYPKDYKDINELKASYDLINAMLIKVRN